MVRVGELFTVVTPMRCTTSGKRGSAWLTRFCTSCCARSGLTPSLKVTVSVIAPSEVACDCMYSMPSTPLICSSIGVATISAMVSGLAPGYWALTTTDGGTTSGYSEIGRFCIAIRPPIRMMHDSTPAKMGRSIKNLEIFMVGSGGSVRCRGREHRHHVRRYHVVRVDALQAVDDDLVILAQAFAHHARAVDDGTELDQPVQHLVAGAQQHYVAVVLVGADRLVVDQQRGDRLAAGGAHPRVHAGQQHAVRVVEDGAHADGAGDGVELVVEGLDAAAVRIAGLGGQADADQQVPGAGVAGRAVRGVADVGRLVDVEVDVDRRHRHQRRQRRDRARADD